MKNTLAYKKNNMYLDSTLHDAHAMTLKIGPIFRRKISNFLSNFWPDFCPKISNSGPIFENGVAYKKNVMPPTLTDERTEK